MQPLWVDSHCHLDAAEFDPDRAEVRTQARATGVGHCVIPAVEVANFDTVRSLAHQYGDSYCLGIHPLYVPRASESDLQVLEAALVQHHEDPRLVAVGEIGLDFFVPALCASPLREKQEFFYRAQLRLARRFGLPVVLHVRRSADRLLKYLREAASPGGIAHAFNGSWVQAQAFVEQGFCLGFGGAMTFDRATQLRHLATLLPLEALALETDAPDIPPHWVYRSAAERSAGAAQGRNAPAELPRIAAVLAALRGTSVEALAQQTTANVVRALPRVKSLLV